MEMTPRENPGGIPLVHIAEQQRLQQPSTCLLSSGKKLSGFCLQCQLTSSSGQRWVGQGEKGACCIQGCSQWVDKCRNRKTSSWAQGTVIAWFTWCSFARRSGPAGRGRLIKRKVVKSWSRTDMIRTSQRPVVLVGFSAGANLAMCTALALEAKNCSVPMVAMYC